MMSQAVEAHGPGWAITDSSGANGLINHLYKKKQNGAKNAPLWNSIYNQLGETAKPHPQYKHTGTFLLDNF